MLRRSLIVSSLILLAGSGLALAQARKPLSPAGTASTMVGGTWTTPEKGGEPTFSGGKWIEIAYSRPMLRGRTDIFGKGADYGRVVNGGAPVWRAGANATTKLNTEVALEIGGKKVEPGSYDVFVDLKEGGWTLILSTQPAAEKYDPNDKTKIWGSYGYDPKFDVLRAPMLLGQSHLSIDQFTIAFVDMTAKGGTLAMAWDKTVATVPFTVVQ